MDFDNFLIGIEAFLRGEPRPLPLPASVQTELTINACFEEPRRSWAENGRNVGYQFPWGQIQEEFYATTLNRLTVRCWSATLS